ncbi:MAG: flagellar hook capping FlgD N-terminal domain-containing protein [Pseudomonadota bacterium]
MTAISSNIPSDLTLAQPANATGNSELSQESFLKLLTAQLQYQDPFKPVDNQEMVAQMASISTSTGITEMKESLEAIASSLNSSRLADTASWIGHSILVPGQFAVADTNGNYGGEFNLNADTDSLSIDLLNSSGEIVQYVELGAQKAGPIAFSFDSENTDLGRLRVRVNGGQISDLATWVPVASVSSPASGQDAKLVTPVGNFDPSEALRLG